MTLAPDPVLQALVAAAVAGTGAGDGWVLAVRGDMLEVVASSGSLGAAAVGARVAGDSGLAGYVVGSGQPLAIRLSSDDPRAASGMAALLGRPPSSVVCVPCDSDDGVVGVLEVVDKAGSDMFTFDDVELATMLAGIAGAALASDVAQGSVAAPAELAGELHRLHDSDRTQYANVARIVTQLIHGA